MCMWKELYIEVSGVPVFRYLLWERSSAHVFTFYTRYLDSAVGLFLGKVGLCVCERVCVIFWSVSFFGFCLIYGLTACIFAFCSRCSGSAICARGVGGLGRGCISLYGDQVSPGVFRGGVMWG